MPFFSRVFRSKDSAATKKQAKPAAAAADPVPAKPKWTDAWQRTEVAPEEVQDLIRGCTQELKARGGWNSVPNHVVVLRLPRAFFGWLIIRPFQRSIPHSFSCPSVRAPTPALPARSFATTSTSLSRRAHLSAEMA